MKHLHLDLETYSEANLPKTGGQFYARHPSTRVLMLAYSYGDEIHLIDLENGGTLPDALLADLKNPNVTKWAHNAAFERAILSNVLNVPCDPEQWRCTMVWAMSLSLPAGLDKLSEALKLGTDAKDKEGKRLIRKFCLPGGDVQQDLNDDDWRRFCEYCRQDVAAEMAVARRLKRYALPDSEWQAWAVDQRVNDNGLPIDIELVQAIRRVAETYKEDTAAEAARITQLPNPNSRDQMLSWLGQRGVDADDLTSGTVDQLLAGDLPPAVRKALECRQQMSKASLAKFDALDRATCPDGRLRGAFQFAGAGRTGRFAGRIFQPQNLPRPTLSDADIDVAREAIRTSDADTMGMMYDDLSGALSSLIRSVIAAPAGRQLVVADYASIESIMVAWCAESDYLLNLYHKGLDPYKDFATKIYGIAYEDVTKAQRSFAKPAVLGCFASGTQVLTRTGPVDIVNISDQHELWDGVEWVRSEGVIPQGEKQVVERAGVFVTPDHLILTDSGWQQVADLTDYDLNLAIQLARGTLSTTAESTGCVGAATAQNLSGSTLLTSTSEKHADASRALTALQVRNAAPRLNSALNSATMTGLQTACTRSAPGARIQTTPAMRTTERGEYDSTSKVLKKLSRTLSRCKDGIIRILKLTASTTTGVTSPATCDSLTDAETPPTRGNRAGLSTKGGLTRTASSTGGSPLNTAMLELSGARRHKEKQPRKSSRSNPVAEVPTYDLLNAGPRNRYTILTDEGPLIVHNCGYGLGATGLQRYAEAFGMEMTASEAKKQVDTFRSAYSDIPEFWAKLETAVTKTMQSKGRTVRAGRFTFQFDGRFLLLGLPSGRHLYYYQPRMETGNFGKLELTYAGKEPNVRVGTHPGKIVENVVQAVARDLLIEGLKNTQAAGFEIVGHVHDEIICLADADDAGAEQRLLDAMTKTPDWCKDAPVRADGYTAPYYRK